MVLDFLYSILVDCLEGKNLHKFMVESDRKFSLWKHDVLIVVPGKCVTILLKLCYYTLEAVLQSAGSYITRSCIAMISNQIKRIQQDHRCFCPILLELTFKDKIQYIYEIYSNCKSPFLVWYCITLDSPPPVTPPGSILCSS